MRLKKLLFYICGVFNIFFNEDGAAAVSYSMHMIPCYGAILALQCRQGRNFFPLVGSFTLVFLGSTEMELYS